ncbi:MAG: hypothetical protein HQ557_06590 [Bacteroidetes bacterium]|nr:hypothetical protein [Bacteroidota bacterium]
MIIASCTYFAFFPCRGTLIEFDELTHFSDSMFLYMLSRNRTTCSIRPYISPKEITLKIVWEEVTLKSQIEGDNGFLYESKVCGDEEEKYTQRWDGGIVEI